jgi:hypothetical protein
MEIINAMTVPAAPKQKSGSASAGEGIGGGFGAEPGSKQAKEVRFTTDLVEGMLRESMYASVHPSHASASAGGGLGAQQTGGWTTGGRDGMDESSEFQAMVSYWIIYI